MRRLCFSIAGIHWVATAQLRHPSRPDFRYSLIIMPATVYRLANPGDAYEIAVMSRYLIEVGLRGWTWPPERVAKSIKARDTNVLVVDVKNTRVGFAIMDFGATTAHLSLLAVKPTHQRCGIGRKLMAWLEEAALTAGITTVSLELRSNNFAARTFYRMLGYKELAYIPGYYRGVETAVKMARDIRRIASRPMLSDKS
jgi:ribosomal-protein-alanine N-acetyltransferase